MSNTILGSGPMSKHQLEQRKMGREEGKVSVTGNTPVLLPLSD